MTHIIVERSISHVPFSLPIHLLTTHENMLKEFLIVLFWVRWLNGAVTHSCGLFCFMKGIPTEWGSLPPPPQAWPVLIHMSRHAVVLSIPTYYAHDPSGWQMPAERVQRMKKREFCCTHSLLALPMVSLFFLFFLSFFSSCKLVSSQKSTLCSQAAGSPVEAMQYPLGISGKSTHSSERQLYC